MASLYPKKISGKTYWYLREMARVGGRPKMVSERYVGTAAQIEALLDARERQIMPDRTRHLAFGDVAAAWGMLEDLRVAGGPGAGQPGDRRAHRGGLRAGLLVGGPGHDQLRYLHRHRERQGADRPAGEGQAEAHRPADRRAGPGGHPRRRDPAGLARLPRRPARRHPVPGDDQPAADTI